MKTKRIREGYQKLGTLVDKEKKEKGKSIKDLSFLSRLRSKLFNVFHPFRNVFVCDTSGDGYDDSVNEKSKEGVLIDLYKIHFHQFSSPDYKLNDSAEPILYGNNRIWCFCACFWYAFEFGQVHYAFDIRALAKKIGFGNPEDEMMDIIINKRNWLLKFINELETSGYFIDIENSIKRLSMLEK